MKRVTDMFEAFLQQQDSAAWASARQTLLPSIHEVDRDATRIWFFFYPLKLAQTLAGSDDLATVTRRLGLEGSYRLADQIDTSHWFLYGHRYWPEVKRAIVERADHGPLSSLDLVALIRELSREVASRLSTSDDLVVGIVSVGLMTLAQVGAARFAQVPAPPRAVVPSASPAAILATRRRDDGQGLFGFLRAGRSQFGVRFDERRTDGRFTVIANQNVTTAAAADTRDYNSGPRPSREGPIPVQCRTGSCGTCWVGVLGGADKLSPVDAHEAKRMKEFGYISSTEPQPIIRLACMSVAHGNVTLVIPPWNGVLGKAGLGGL